MTILTKKEIARWNSFSLEEKVEELKRRLDEVQQCFVATIDWCVAFNGANTDVLSRVFFGSLFRYCNPVYTGKVQFHLIDNGNVRAMVNLEHGPRDPIWHCPDEKWKPSKLPTDYFAESILTPWTIAEYMVDNCGDTSWCIISHFDMIFKNDILARIIELMAEDVGIIGTHCPIMAINRKAYKSRRVGFSPGVDYDVGIMLERDLQSQGWKHKPFSDSIKDTHFTHLGAGASYHNKQEFDWMRQRATSRHPNDW